MEIGKMLAGVAVGLSTLGIAASAWAVGPVNVPSHSFESPEIPNSEPYAGPFFDNWQKNADPNFFTSSGIFLNVDTAADSDPDIAILDGDQSAFLFGNPGAEIYQDLAATYQVGESYHLTIAIDGGGFGMPLGERFWMRLYYRDPTAVDPGEDDRFEVGKLEILNTHPLTNPLTPITALTDFTLNIPNVQVSDLWAGKAIGIQFISPPASLGGYWDFDNVRLTSVPEPTMMGLVAAAGACLLRRRRS